MGRASKEEVWCKEATVEQADRRKKKNAFQRRRSAISYTAKVNLEKIEIPSYHLCQGLIDYDITKQTSV